MINNIDCIGLLYLYIILNESDLDCDEGRKENICENPQNYDNKTAYYFATAFSIEIWAYVKEYLPRICFKNARGLKKSNFSLPSGSGIVG